jgi:hypothetical protein
MLIFLGLWFLFLNAPYKNDSNTFGDMKRHTVCSRSLVIWRGMRVLKTAELPPNFTHKTADLPEKLPNPPCLRPGGIVAHTPPDYEGTDGLGK